MYNNTTSMPWYAPSSNYPLSFTGLPSEDIRLCTIHRTDHNDTYGFEIRFHYIEQMHSIILVPGRNNRPSNAELAGIKTDDCPIEINDQNIQTWNLEDIHNFIRTIEYPRPLQMLVTDRSTYDYYTQQHIPIHRHLPNVRIMSFNTVHDQQSLTHPTMINGDHGRKHHLQHDPDFPNYGLRIETIEQFNNREHQIISIIPYSQADIQGLRIGDNISQINNQIVQNMNEIDVNNLIRSCASSKMNLLMIIKDRHDINQQTLINTDRSHISTDRTSSSKTTAESFDMRSKHEEDNQYSNRVNSEFQSSQRTDSDILSNSTSDDNTSSLSTFNSDRTSETVGKGKIEIEKGDITKQKVDVIVTSCSSWFLREEIIKKGGNEVQNSFDIQFSNHPNAMLIITPPGRLSCRKLFFVKWQPHSDENILRQSLKDLISTTVQNGISHKFTSMALPAIGCGKHDCSLDIIVTTMIQEMKSQLINRNLPWTVKFIIQPEQQNVYDEFCRQLLSTQDGLHELQLDRVPSTWEKSTKHQIRFVLSTASDEYKTIASNFDQALKGTSKEIIRIERIQNERWYIQYLAHLKDFKRRLNRNTEKRLYHGCPEEAASSILEDGFNRSYAGKNGTKYGFGVYFSSNANYSHNYAKPNANSERFIFVSRVLIGKTTKGDESMKTRPLGFDSTTDNDHIFVTYHDAQAYAEYLITYK